MIIKTDILRRQALGGAGLETIYIPIPKNVRVLQYGYFLTGAGNALVHSLDMVVFDQELGLSAVLINAVGSIFTNVVTGTGAGTVVALGRATHLRWRTQPNGATSNDFYLNFGFADV